MARPAVARDHAAVIGGGIAGLLAARVLADHFARVTLIERDRYPDGPDPRKGAPRARMTPRWRTRSTASCTCWTRRPRCSGRA